MSDLRNKEDCSLLCPICIKTFTTPRTIVGCNHSFCEQCLFTYVSTLSHKGELGSKFPCPVCKHEVSTPSDGNISMEWIHTFPIKESETPRLDRQGGQNSQGKELVSLCDPCIRDGEEKNAIKFCVDCHEKLCKICVDNHRKYKVFKGHILTSRDAIKMMFEEDLRTSVKCEKHPDRNIEIFCLVHQSCYCLMCVTMAHRECPGLLEIKEMEAGATEKMTELQEKYEKLEKHMDYLNRINDGSLTNVCEKSQHFLNRMQATRDKINIEIDNIIEHVKKQTRERLTGIVEIVEATTIKFNSIKERCQTNKELVSTINEHGHPVHKVVKQKKLKDEYLNVIEEIDKQERSITMFNFKCESMTRLESVYQDILKCKQSQVTIDTGSIDFVRYVDIVNQMKDRKIVTNWERTVTLTGMCLPAYTGVTTIDSARVLLCDNCSYNDECGHVCLYDIKSKSISKLKMNKPFSAAVLKSNPSNIAVSVPLEKKIHVISIKGSELKIERTLHTDKTPYSIISLQNGYLGVTRDSPPSFDIVDVSGNELKIVKSYTQDNKGRQFKSFKYVAVDEFRSHIIQPCQTDKAVYCFEFMGNPVYKYKDPELNGPMGVAVDRDGNIYICSFYTNALHVLTPSGRKVKVIKEGIPSYLQAICFDETGQKFFLTSTASDSYDKLWLVCLQK